MFVWPADEPLPLDELLEPPPPDELLLEPQPVATSAAATTSGARSPVARPRRIFPMAARSSAMTTSPFPPDTRLAQFESSDRLANLSMYCSVCQGFSMRRVQLMPRRPVLMEEMTWPEVRAAASDGLPALVPVGSTEQH